VRADQHDCVWESGAVQTYSGEIRVVVIEAEVSCVFCNELFDDLEVGGVGEEFGEDVCGLRLCMRHLVDVEADLGIGGELCREEDV